MKRLKRRTGTADTLALALLERLRKERTGTLLYSFQRLSKRTLSHYFATAGATTAATATATATTTNTTTAATLMAKVIERMRVSEAQFGLADVYDFSGGGSEGAVHNAGARDGSKATITSPTDTRDGSMAPITSISKNTRHLRSNLFVVQVKFAIAKWVFLLFFVVKRIRDGSIGPRDMGTLLGSALAVKPPMLRPGGGGQTWGEIKMLLLSRS